MLNALTIDVEDYYQVSGFESVVRFEEWSCYESRVGKNTRRILEILRIHNVKATFFILGWVAERHPDIVKAIHDEGHEVASHGYAHKLVYRMTPQEFRHDVKRAKWILEDIIGEKVIGYRAASYSITKESLWGLEILAEEGFCYDSSIFSIRHDRYGFPQFERFPTWVNGNGKDGILEFPLSTIRIARINFPIAGGGYLRLFPYFFIRMGIRHINEKERQPAIIYLHPWEIDPEQPRLNASPLSKFRHYINLDGTEEKLKRLIEDFKFVPITELLRGKILNGNTAIQW